jgi:hypothetical protein
VDTEKLEALDPLHYSPIDVDVVHNQLLCLVDVEGEDVVSDLLPIGCLIVVCDSSCTATQSWVNRKYRRRLNMHP